MCGFFDRLLIDDPSRLSPQFHIVHHEDVVDVSTDTQLRSLINFRIEESSSAARSIWSWVRKNVSYEPQRSSSK